MSATSLSALPEATGRTVAARVGAVRALVRRDWRIMRSYRTAFVTDLTFGFLNLVAYYYISKTVRPRIHGGLDGAPSYFAFAAVGVALTVVLQASIVGIARRLREEQLTGTLEALLVQPVSTPELTVGLTGFPFVFAMARALLYLLLGAAFLGLRFGRCDWPGLILAFAVSGVAFAGLGVLLAGVVLVFKRADAIGAVSSFGLGLLGGAFFPTRVLPGWIRPLAGLAPTRYAFEAVRGALFGRAWAGPTATLAIIALVTVGIGFTVFRLALRHVILQGTLNQY